MTTYRIVCRTGEVIASERDRFRQFDGSTIPASALTTAHTVPGRGRVLSVDPLAGASALPCTHCDALLPDVQAVVVHRRDVHRMALT